MTQPTMSRQAARERAHKARGLCKKCKSPGWEHGVKTYCFRHTLMHALDKRGILSYARKREGPWNLFVNAMSARYARVLLDEGFATDAIRGPERIIEAVGFKWAKGRMKTKLLEVIARFDDHAIRKRFQG